MNKDFPYLIIPASLKPVVGEPDLETRIYRREGSDEDSGPWFDALCEHFPGDSFISPGGVGMYAPVSRAGVHKRLKEGNLTAFCFHVVKAERSLFGYQKKLKERPYIYVPVGECKAWGEDLKARPDRKAAYVESAGGEKPDGEGKFLLEPKKGTAAKKTPPQEMVELVRQALKEVLAEDFPTLMGEEFRKKVAAKAKAKVAGRKKK